MDKITLRCLGQGRKALWLWQEPYQWRTWSLSCGKGMLTVGPPHCVSSACCLLWGSFCRYADQYMQGSRSTRVPTSGPSRTRLHQSASQVPGGIPELSAQFILNDTCLQQSSPLLVLQTVDTQWAVHPAWRWQRACRRILISSTAMPSLIATGLGLSTTCLKRSLPAAKRAMQAKCFGRALVRLKDLLDPMRHASHR